MTVPAPRADLVPPPAGRRAAAWVAVVVAVLAAAYVAQVPTPLRMNTDAIAYLTMAGSHNDGRGYTVPNWATHFPTGYPAVVAALERHGMATSRAFVAFNELALAVALWAGAWVVRRWLGLPPWAVLAAVAMTLLSRSTIRYAAIPGSEFAYMAVSTLGLACLVRAVGQPRERTGRAMMWWAAGVLGLASVWFRTVGVVLAPAIGWALVQILWQRRRSPVPLRQWAASYRRPLLVTAAVAMVMAVGLGWAVSRTMYAHEGMAIIHRHGLVRTIHDIVRNRMIDAASMATNFWSREVEPARQRRLVFAGVVALPLTLVVIARRVRHLGPVDVYLMAYVGVLMVWPYKADNRFWMPVELFIYALFARELLAAADRPWARAVAVGWAALFLATGVAVLAWSTRLTYAGDRFADRFDLEQMQDAYWAAAVPGGRLADPAHAPPGLLAAIRRYGRPQFGP